MNKKSMFLGFVVVAVGLCSLAIYLKLKSIRNESFQRQPQKITVEIISRHPKINKIGTGDLVLWDEYLREVNLAPSRFFLQKNESNQSIPLTLDAPIKKLLIVFTDQLLLNAQVSQDPQKRVIEQASALSFDSLSGTLKLEIFINSNFLNLPKLQKLVYLNQTVGFMVAEIASHRFLGADPSSIDIQSKFVSESVRFILDQGLNQKYLISLPE